MTAAKFNTYLFKNRLFGGFNMYWPLNGYRD